MRIRSLILACACTGTLPLMITSCGSTTPGPQLCPCMSQQSTAPSTSPPAIPAASAKDAISPVDPKHNWVVNGGFEDQDMSEWEGARLVSPGHASSRALLLENQTPTWNAASQRIRFGSGRLPSEMILSGWIRTEGVVAGKESWMMARAIVDFADADGRQVGGWQRGAVGIDGTTDWTPFEHAYAVPAGAVSVKLEASLPNIPGKAWFDDLRVVFVDSDGTRRVDSRPRVEKTATADWYAFVPPKSPDGAALDLSFMNDKPAGKHGPVTVARGHFVFRDGTPARFWGTNLVGEHAFPKHDAAAATARRLAKLGVNLVRLHHMDAAWAKPNIFDPVSDDTQKFSEESLDRLDYLIAELKKNGIYVYPDLLVHRKYRKGDGVADYEKLAPGAKGVAHFDSRIIDLNHLYAKMLLSHKNKYTGMALAEDPVMVGTEVVNESSIFLGFNADPYPPAYQAELQSLYESAGGHGKLARFAFDWSNERLTAIENEANAADTMRFLASLADKTNAGMKAQLKSVGSKALLTGSNMGLPVLAEIRANSRLDFIDSHHYWDHPKVWKVDNDWSKLDEAPFDNKPQLRDPAGASPGRLAMWAVKDKPFLATEWNDCFPNEYRLEAPVMMAAYASLQDWDGLLQFDYRHGVPGSSRMHQFGIQSRPDNEALFAVSALLYRKRYLLSATREFIEEIDDATALAPASTSRLLFDEPWLPYAVRVAKRFVGSEKAEQSSLDALRPLHDTTARAIRATTGQIVWRYGRGLLTVDSPKAQGFTGEVGRGDRLETKDLSIAVDPRNPWASVMMVSLDDRPIAESSRLVLVAVARAENTGQTFNMTRTALKSIGDAPVLMQGVQAEITLKSPRARGFVVRPLDSDGIATGTIALKAEGTGTSFTISPQHKTALYLLTRNR